MSKLVETFYSFIFGVKLNITILIYRPLLLNTNGAPKKNLYQHIVKEPTDNHHHKVNFNAFYIYCLKLNFIVAVFHAVRAV
jgi:hypothetical protein